MIQENYKELKKEWLLSKNKKLIGIDWGEVRIGIAVSDNLGIIASNLCTVLVRKNKTPKKHFFAPASSVPTSRIQIKSGQDAAIEEVAGIIIKENPFSVIIGLPLNMNGSFGFQANNVVSFAKKLATKIQVPIFFKDERLSSSAVEKLMIDSGFTRSKRQKVIDKVSAAYVLQGVVDYFRNN